MAAALFLLDKLINELTVRDKKNTIMTAALFLFDKLCDDSRVTVSGSQMDRGHPALE